GSLYDGQLRRQRVSLDGERDILGHRQYVTRDDLDGRRIGDSGRGGIRDALEGPLRGSISDHVESTAVDRADVEDLTGAPVGQRGAATEKQHGSRRDRDDRLRARVRARRG